MCAVRLWFCAADVHEAVVMANDGGNDDNDHDGVNDTRIVYSIHEIQRPPAHATPSCLAVSPFAVSPFAVSPFAVSHARTRHAVAWQLPECRSIVCACKAEEMHVHAVPAPMHWALC